MDSNDPFNSRDPVKRANAVAAEYQRRLKNPNWRLGEEKDLEDFSRGAQQSGSLGLGEMADNLKRAWGNLRK